MYNEQENKEIIIDFPEELADFVKINFENITYLNKLYHVKDKIEVR